METFNQPAVPSFCGDWDSDRDPSSSHQGPGELARPTLTEPQTPLPHQLEDQQMVSSQTCSSHILVTFVHIYLLNWIDNVYWVTPIPTLSIMIVLALQQGEQSTEEENTSPGNTSELQRIPPQLGLKKPLVFRMSLDHQYFKQCNLCSH